LSTQALAGPYPGQDYPAPAESPELDFERKKPNQPRIFGAFSGREFSHHLRRLHCQHKLKESVSHNELGKQNRDHHPFTTSHQVFDCAAMRKPGENIGTGVEQTL
jgi:hypothetical protein